MLAATTDGSHTARAKDTKTRAQEIYDYFS